MQFEFFQPMQQHMFLYALTSYVLQCSYTSIYIDTHALESVACGIYALCYRICFCCELGSRRMFVEL